MRSTSGSPPLSIGALAERFRLAPHVLRHWEATGLLTPARDPAGRRRYGPADVTRVAVILLAKEAGLSLDVIRSLTATADPAARRAVVEGEAAQLRRRIAAAQASLGLLECALGCAHEDITACPHYRQAVKSLITGEELDEGHEHGQLRLQMTTGARGWGWTR
ncbi:MerR family transcriptional regulator [Streptomyces sp. NPDC004059]